VYIGILLAHSILHISRIRVKMGNTYFTSTPVPLAHMGKRRGVYSFLVGKPEGKRLLGRLRHRWQDITMDLQLSGMWGHGLDRSDSG
jgi:hypothetical protein